jgi:hypothetical protein
MSLQTLNPEYQLELADRPKPRSNPLRGAFQKMRSDKVGSVFRGEYPNSNRLEELLLDFE